MSKKGIVFVIISSLVLGALGSWILQRYAIPKLNTVPFLVRHNLAPKAGPIVINTKEEIHINEGSDTIAAIRQVQPWTVAVISNGQVVAGGLILTSDGLIATTSAVQNLPDLSVKLMDGTRLSGAKIVALDQASPLVFIKADGSNLPTANFGRPEDLELSQRLVALMPSVGEQQASALLSSIATTQRNIDYNKIYSADKIQQTFSVQGLDNTPEGSVLLSADGNVQGIFAQGSVIPANVITSALNGYFANGAKIIRPELGLNYQYIPKALAASSGQKAGVVVKHSDKAIAVLAGSPAQKGGFAEGDIIYAIDDTQIDVNNNFEDLLERHKPGDTVKFSIQRGKDLKTLSAVLGAE